MDILGHVLVGSEKLGVAHDSLKTRTPELSLKGLQSSGLSNLRGIEGMCQNMVPVSLFSFQRSK